MLKTLDRYIIRQFLGTFFLLLVLIMAIAVVFDISEKTGDFAKSHATTREIVVDYYVNFILYYANFFSGLFIFLAVLLFTSRLAGRSEVIAMLSGGVSFNRFVRPYMIAATFLAAISLYLNVFLLPGANRTRLAFEKAERAAALPCYADTEQTLEAIIRETLKAAGLTVASEGSHPVTVTL
ncbi:MAG TPA: LptF/LptG family permease, partial [Flavobacteriales bacterium]|nr:LptF/LptG family permease [Flavobacteriales bacterium]